MVEPRSATNNEDKWNVEDLFTNYENWQKIFNELIAEKPWSQLSQFQGKLNDASSLLKAIELFFSINRRIEKLYTYAHLRHDEDITEEEAKNCYERIVGTYHEFKELSSWLEPEILNLPKDVMQNHLQSTELKDYKFFLERLFFLKDHTLSPNEEKLIAQAGLSLDTAHKAFSSLTNADFKFPSVKDSNGKDHELTPGLLRLYLRSRDRTLRQNSFVQFHKQYTQYENTISDLLQGQIQTHLFYAKSHNYESCLQAALKTNNIPTQVYHSLIKAVHDNIGSLHKYISLRKKLLGYDHLYHWDMFVPLTKELEIKMEYAEAEKAVIESVAPLGKDYQEILKKGMLTDRWVDRYENKNKRQGAYSSGCFDSHPYILMNYRGLLNDAFTLAHEAGHSMHSYLSHTSQPYQYSSYPIFVAEVASTFNEELLSRALMKKIQSKEERICLLTEKIQDIYGTLFRQTLFAEFELMIHQHVENKIPLTPTLLKEEFAKLNQFYFGPDFTIDPEVSIEWARVPHFYYNFYVYQYATGISAALALVDIVVDGSEQAKQSYLNFLKGGSSKYPIDLLKMAGVDMESPEPVAIAIKRFDQLVEELSSLINS
ncbi:MAG: oligoendopeptidase F [Parachlamydiales bacterium]|nr:oligoendopeptidase F [Parachlamydiales bacterium]